MSSRQGERSGDRAALVSPNITFASEEDATQYRSLLKRQQRLETQLERVEQEISAIMRRAYWSLDAIIENEG